MRSQKISAIIISKNEEERIADCLDSVSFCDEIVLVDSNSTDRTSEIAKRMNAKVFNVGMDDFSKLRNFGLEKAKGDWILYVDADERVTPSLREEIIRSINNPIGQYAGFRIQRKNFYFGNHEWPAVEKLERMFRKDSLQGWHGRLHESPKVSGSIGDLDGYLFHYSHRDIASMLAKTLEWSEIEAELRFRAGHPKVVEWRFFRVILTAFFDSYVKQEGWKAGVVGLVESVYQAFSIFITYARLWELQQK